MVDSIEHFRGTARTEDEVQQCIERLFGENSDALHFRNLHIVYTVPAYLRVRVPNVAERFEPGLGIQMLPTVKVRTQAGDPYPEGMDALELLVRARGDWKEVMSSDHLERLCQMSGGHLRDLMRMMQDLLRRLRQRGIQICDRPSCHRDGRGRPPRDAPDRRRRRRMVVAHSRGPRVPAADDRPAAPALPAPGQARRLCFRNGKEWYDVHPLVVGNVKRQVARLRDAEIAAARALRAAAGSWG